ncbi:MAG: hypothetical protein HY815_21010, partial [Candidatus Riflebacteria bacterium]|nr:hypothetical protein [Candidatus Riflebacteria bacterium]
MSVPEGAPEGDYQIRIGNVGPRIFTGSFRVSAYTVPTVIITIDPEATVLSENEPFKGKLVVTRADGSPVKEMPLRYRIDGQGETFGGTTSDRGELAVSVDTRDLADGTYTLRAWIDQEAVQASSSFSIASVGVKPKLTLARDVVLTGEQLPVRIAARDALDKPLKVKGTVQAVRRVRAAV